MTYNERPRKTHKKESLKNWTEANRKQDRTHHPFHERNMLLKREIVVILDEFFHDTNFDSINRDYENFETVDGDKSTQEIILQKI